MRLKTFLGITLIILFSGVVLPVYSAPDKDKPTHINNIDNSVVNYTLVTQKYKDKVQGMYAIQWKDTRRINIASTIAYDVVNNVVEARFFQFTYKLGRDWQEAEIDKINNRLENIEKILNIKDNGIIVGRTKEGKDIINNGKTIWIK